MMTLVYRIFGSVGLCIVLFASGYLIGHHRGVVSVKSAQEKVTYKVELGGLQINRKVVAQLNTSMASLNTVVLKIEKRIPIYVTPKDDRKCTINRGFVRLWNFQNQMRVPDSTFSTDATPSNVVLSDIATQHGREVQIYEQTKTQLAALQDWVRKQQELYKATK